MTDKMILFDIKLHKDDVMLYVYDLLEYAFSLSVCCVNPEEFDSLNLSTVFGVLDKVLAKSTGIEKPEPKDTESRIDSFVEKASNDEELCEILCKDSDDRLMKMLKELAKDVFKDGMC